MFQGLEGEQTAEEFVIQLMVACCLLAGEASCGAVGAVGPERDVPGRRDSSPERLEAATSVDAFPAHFL